MIELMIEFSNLCKNGNIDKVKSLLEQYPKIDINYQEINYLYTPLMMASIHNNIKIVKLLIEYKVDINIRSKYCKSAIVYAYLNNNINITIILLENIKHKYIPNEHDISLLNEVVSRRETKLLKLLLSGNIMFDKDLINSLNVHELAYSTTYNTWKVICESCRSYVLYKNDIQEFKKSFNILLFIFIYYRNVFVVPNEIILIIRNSELSILLKVHKFKLDRIV